ncbi:MAG TPA: helix-turn-helix domain-containing protein [Dongiaceae bacterium]|nr:helix-turn-helix domain-containing protein [Dongiaceae bacterium]
MSEENKRLATEEEVKSDHLKKLPDLKTLREARGLTTEDIFLKTRINAAILNAIENGEFHLLPPPHWEIWAGRGRSCIFACRSSRPPQAKMHRWRFI